jgi:hypothetical protein
MRQKEVDPLSSALGIVNGAKNFYLNLNAKISELLSGAFPPLQPSFSFAVTRGSSLPKEVNLVMNDTQSGKIQLDQDTRKITFKIEEKCIGAREENDPISVVILDKDSKPVSWITLNRENGEKWEGTGDFSPLKEDETYRYMIF